ncbi:MAG: DUF6265 family protein [Caulobacter sp.]|nr:DUF6265 family protein [Caulobacter sp.]
MKRLVLTLLLCAAPAAANEPATVADLAWMSGEWIQETDGGTVRETWSTPYQGAMAGVGQTHRPGKPMSPEFMTITTRPAGVTFTAYVAGRPPTPFLLKPGQPGVAEFENLGHDFPQRVIYRRCEADLCARIEGMADGKTQGMDWRYRRAR